VADDSCKAVWDKNARKACYSFAHSKILVTFTEFFDSLDTNDGLTASNSARPRLSAQRPNTNLQDRTSLTVRLNALGLKEKDSSIINSIAKSLALDPTISDTNELARYEDLSSQVRYNFILVAHLPIVKEQLAARRKDLLRKSDQNQAWMDRVNKRKEYLRTAPIPAHK
jgi:hypothetical protein